jgi:hypothetical protein
MCNFTSVLYGCETWPLTIREVHRLRVFGDRVLRKIFGLNKRVKMAGGWRTQHNAELHKLYALPKIIIIIIRVIK